jgi:hypothetical protein
MKFVLAPIQSLGQQTDVCGNTVALAYPTSKLLVIYHFNKIFLFI